MTFAEIFSQYWLDYLGLNDPTQVSGLVMTLWILVLSLVLAFIMSVPLAILRASDNKLVSRLIKIYTFVFRGTPLYVQLLVVYSGFYSLQIIRNTDVLATFFRDGFNCVIFAFSINTCAYLTEVLAGGIRGIPEGEIEAARSVGMSTFSTYSKIILPSALRRSLPYYSNEVILLLHSTAIAFTATVPEMLKIARDVNSATFAPFASYGIAAVFYACIAFALVGLFRLMERRWLVFQRR